MKAKKQIAIALTFVILIAGVTIWRGGVQRTNQFAESYAVTLCEILTASALSDAVSSEPILVSREHDTNLREMLQQQRELVDAVAALEEDSAAPYFGHELESARIAFDKAPSDFQTMCREWGVQIRECIPLWGSPEDACMKKQTDAFRPKLTAYYNRQKSQ